VFVPLPVSSDSSGGIDLLQPQLTVSKLPLSVFYWTTPTVAVLNGRFRKAIKNQTKQKTDAMIERYTQLNKVVSYNAAQALGLCLRSLQPTSAKAASNLALPTTLDDAIHFVWSLASTLN